METSSLEFDLVQPHPHIRKTVNIYIFIDDEHKASPCFSNSAINPLKKKVNIKKTHHVNWIKHD